jgi:Uma2 family endonuclease
MAEPARKLMMTLAEYFALEEATGIKHEFLAGEVVAMAGGTIEHGRLASKVSSALGAQLQGRPCEVFSSDVRVSVLATGLRTYPDLSVVCTRLERDPENANSVTNPVVLVEVLSDSTEADDRGRKFAHYRRIPSLREYVMVSQDDQRIEVYRRNDADEGWALYEATTGESVRLTSIGCELSVDEVYRSALEG